jgi:uncharacterized membrane protein YhiD involved in acid resistance
MDLLRTVATSGPMGWGDALTALLLSAGLSQAVAWVYLLTFRGLSYSRSFVQAIVLGAIVCCMLLLAIGDSVAAGIGLAGGLSIIRFRTTMRDPRDMVFVFAGLGVGIVCGLRAFPAAVAGTAIFCGAVMLMHVVAYGARFHYDGIVRFAATRDSLAGIREALAAHAPDHALVTLRQVAQGDAWEHAYQVRLGDAARHIELVSALERVPGVRDVRVYLQEPTQEL